MCIRDSRNTITDSCIRMAVTNYLPNKKKLVTKVSDIALIIKQAGLSYLNTVSFSCINLETGQFFLTVWCQSFLVPHHHLFILKHVSSVCKQEVELPIDKTSNVTLNSNKLCAVK